jgi:hypothetical protein
VAFANSSAGDAFFSINNGSGFMIKNNTFMNTWHPFHIDVPFYNIGNHFYSGNNSSTGTMLLNLYNTSGAL